MSEFDLRRRDGLAGFLGMQTAALSVLTGFESSQDCRRVMDDILARAKSDLRVLGVRPNHMTCDALRAPHPLALDYVIAGSRLGTQVLKRRWTAATDPLTQRASAYFSAPTYIEFWRGFCQQTETIPGTDPVAKVVLKDADRIFKFYNACAKSARKSLGVLHV
ncbi:hypothetical protein [Dinoroseobacter sp. S124A]|uniref:hypothetical protein n=1 Tax=Dinoroseobacter sp. S124A TaxID=3415128 RepID=UPI003C7AEE4A